jgi:cell division protein FtsI (penicillin-binding protein 3)
VTPPKVGQPRASARATAGGVGARGTRSGAVRASTRGRTPTPARTRGVGSRPRRPAAPPRRPTRRFGGRVGRPAHRLHAALLAIAFVMIVFTGRLFELQGVDSSVYASEASKQYAQSVTLQADRGTITDRNGVALAKTVDARDITADPLLAKTSTTTNPGAMAYQLAPILGISQAQLATDLTGKGQFVYLARSVTPAVGDAVMKLGLPGVAAADTKKRVYPNGDLAANVIGFVGTDGTGLGGLELQDQKLLAGKNGKQTLEVGNNGVVIPDGHDNGSAPVAGQSIQLTLDTDIQWKAQHALDGAVQSTGANGGTVIVMQPKTGQILAMASSPTFDPNNVGSAPTADLGNAALSDVFEPGSTNKVITMAAAIDSGVLGPESPIDVPPTLDRADQVFHDAEPHGEEHLTLAGVLAESSNIGTILASERVGVTKLYDYLRAFGLGQDSGLGFPGESPGILDDPSKWSASQRYTIPFGQGLSVNALQVASVYSTIANGGIRVTPSLIKGYVQPDGSVKPAPAPTQTRVVSQTTATEVESMLEAVTTDEGTAPEARIDGYRVAGKTGTAQRVDSSCSCYRGYTASFVGFAPADDPQLVVLVVLDNPINGHYGGTVAAPVFKDVMSFALEAEKVPPTGTKPPVVKLTTS